MFVLLVEVSVKPECVKEFVAAINENAYGANALEEGCLRFDVLEDNEDPNKFYLYEVYTGPEAFKMHRESAHFKKYADTTKDFYTAPVIRRMATNRYPIDNEWR